jgi:hypothetical protein
VDSVCPKIHQDESRDCGAMPRHIARTGRLVGNAHAAAVPEIDTPVQNRAGHVPVDSALQMMGRAFPQDNGSWQKPPES